MLFSIWFLALELVVVVNCRLAFKKNVFSRSQGLKSSKKIGYFIEHVGMWGDFFLISPLIAFMISQYHGEWSLRAIALSLTVSSILGGFMANQWRLASNSLDDTFNQDGKILLAGWLHLGYMVIGLTVVFLYYFGTPHESLRGHVIVVTILLALHSTVSTLMPPYITYGKVRRSDIITAGVCLILLTIGFYCIVS